MSNPLRIPRSKAVFAVLGSALVAAIAIAQQPMRLPKASPCAVVKQTIGLNDVTITYSRPGVKGRKIWGGLVPYGTVWRTGANSATTIQFTEDVLVEGQPLAAGTYSLHTIPGEKEWTLILNKDANQWGSYSYDPAKDALRVKVTPVAGGPDDPPAGDRTSPPKPTTRARARRSRAPDPANR